MADYEVKPIEDRPALVGLGAYYLTKYLDAVRETFGESVELYGVHSGGVTRAIFPLLRKGKKAVLPPLGQYWGLWPLPSEESAPGRAEAAWEKTVLAVDGHLRGLGLVEVSFIHPPHVSDARPFLRLGWEVTPRYTYLVPPEGEGAWDSSTRRQWGKFEKSGLELHPVASWEKLYRLHREGMVRQNLPYAPEALVRGLAKRGKVFETPTAAALLGADETAGYYVLAASDPAGHGDGSPTALVGRILAELGREGLELDFVGANTERLCRFKRGFGGRLVPYFQTRVVFARTRRLLQGLKRTLGG